MTQPICPQRAATVSVSALLLCLAGGGSALAATTPEGALTGTASTAWSTATSILPGPTPSGGTSLPPAPTPVPTDPSPVTSTLRSLAGATASPAPTPTSLAGAAAGSGAAASGGTNRSSVRRPPAGSGPRTSAAPGGGSAAQSGSNSGTRTPGDGPTPVGSLLAGPAEFSAFPGQVPMLAPQRAQLMAAGRAPALATASGPASGGWDGHDPNVLRGLLVALATMVAGGLAAGHVKSAQNRLVQLGIAPPRYRPTHRRAP